MRQSALLVLVQNELIIGKIMVIIIIKYKVIPLQARCGPEGG